MRKVLSASLALFAAALFGCSGTPAPAGTTGGTATSSTGGTTAATASGGTTAAAATSTGTSGTTGVPTTGGVTTGPTIGSSGPTSGTGSSGTTSTSSSSSTGGTSATTGVGPWPNAALTQYSPGEEIVDVSTDEAENIWAVSHDALYLLRPGQTQFKKFTDADGLHIANAGSPGIMNVAGGKAGEAFVGYNDVDVNRLPQITGDPTQDAPLYKGGLDHVQLNADGTLAVVHPNLHSNDYWVNYPDGGSDTDASFMEDRGTRRMVYDHASHPGTLYIGWNHGVDRFNWGQVDPVTGAMYGDHVHPIVDTYYPDGGVKTEYMGEWRGLAIDPTQNGTLWMGGEYTGGALGWTPGLHDWTCQSSNPLWCPNGANAFVHAWAKKWGAPLFPVASDGDPMNIRAVAVTPDGTTYFASGPQWNPGTDPVYGVAVFKNGQLSYLDPVSQMHLPSNQLMDMVAMPDGTLAIAVLDAGLYRYNPATGVTSQVQGVPAHINMLYLDKLVNPAALYVATDQGFTVVRDTNP